MQRLISSFLKGSVFRDGVTRKVTSLVKSVVRQVWASNIDVRDPRFLAFAAVQHQFLQSDYEEYSIECSGAYAYFRMVVIALMLLLLVRQTLMITKDLGMLQESSTFFRLQIMLLQLAGFLLPCYVMAHSVYIMQCRRRRQV